MTFWRLLLAAVLLCPGLAVAARLRVCTDVLPHPPHLMPDGGGHIGLLVAQAARVAGFDLEFYAAPTWRPAWKGRIEPARLSTPCGTLLRA